MINFINIAILYINIYIFIQKMRSVKVNKKFKTTLGQYAKKNDTFHPATI